MGFSVPVFRYCDFFPRNSGSGVFPTVSSGCDHACISGDHLARLQRGKIKRRKPRAVVVHGSFPCDDCRFPLSYIPINAAETKPGLYPCFLRIQVGFDVFDYLELLRM